MFTTINNNKYKKICTLDTIHVQKRLNTDYRTLLKFFHGHKGFFAAEMPAAVTILLETQVYVSYVVCCHSNDLTAARAYPLLKNK